MSSLRNFVVIVLLAGVLGVVYFAINKGPKPGDRTDLAPPWATAQGDPSKATTPPTPVAASAPQSNAMPGFPSGSALPGTSISSIPAGVTLPAAPTVASISPPPTAAMPYPSTAGALAAPPMGLAPPATAPTPPGTNPAAAAGAAPLTPPPTALPAPVPGGTVILGQAPTNPHTVYPADASSPNAAVPSNPMAGTAAPVSYFQTSPAPPAGPAAQSPPSVVVGLPAVGGGQPMGPAPSTQLPGQPEAQPSFSEQFVNVMRGAKGRLDAGQFGQAHLELTNYYCSGRLAPYESRVLGELLDQLGGTVVYSRDHLLEPPYRVQPGDTVDRVAAAYSVTPELLAKINGLGVQRELTPGQELKVVRGPFEAVVDLSRYEMTLLVGGRYAGRFRIGVGRDRGGLEGVFQVREKRIRPVYYGPDRVMAADDPANPLGGRLLNLGTVTEPWGIHGTDNAKNVGCSEGRGTICLAQRDIDDVFDILAVGSRVTVRR